MGWDGYGMGFGGIGWITMLLVWIALGLVIAALWKYVKK